MQQVPHYLYPDKSRWPLEDGRIALTGFDDEAFRQWYNDCMPIEQPPCPEGHVGLSPKEQMVVDEIAKAHKGGSLLDIGCGNGKFLVGCLNQGIVSEATGIDISDEMVKNAKITAQNNHVEVHVLRSSIENMPTNNQYDVVSAFDVLEHVYALHDALSRILLMVKINGLFCGSVPWLYTCDASTHLHYFTEESLDILLRNFFKEVVVTKMDLTGSPEYHLVFWGTRLS